MRAYKQLPLRLSGSDWRPSKFIVGEAAVIAVSCSQAIRRESCLALPLRPMQRMVNFFAALYSAALSASGVQWCLGLDSSALETALQGLVHAVAGEQPLMNLSEEALRRSAEYKRAIPQIILSGLEESVENFINRHSQLGVPRSSSRTSVSRTEICFGRQRW